MKSQMLSYQQAKSFYDRFGKKQDSQGFYEDVATETLIRNAQFDKAGAVLEFGCGTGRFAELLFEKHLPAHARYVGLDISETMVDLARNRLDRFGQRAKVYLSHGSPRLEFETGAFDRFVSNYVLDLLTHEDNRTLIREAQRVLSEGGLLGITSLTHGFSILSRMVAGIWTAIHTIRPTLVGGCRPIRIREFVTEGGWRIRYDKRLSRYGVPSEILVAEKAAVD